MGHPWSSDVAAQAAIRAAEVDRGPTLCHHEMPATVEALRKRLDTFIEDEQMRHDAMSERVARLSATFREWRTEPAAAVPNPLPEATTGSGSVTGMRTERVTLEITWNTDGDQTTHLADWFPAEVLGRWFCAPGESVRVVPTPGPGLTGDEMSAVAFAANELERVVMFQHRDGEHDDLPFTRLALKGLNSILARDAAARAAT